MSLYELLSTFHALRRLQDERKRGKRVTMDEMDEFKDNVKRLAKSDPTIVWN